LLLIDDFIDDETPIATGSERTSWNSLQNDDDLDAFFTGIYERSKSRVMRPTGTVEDTTDPYDCFLALPGADEFPLWRIACRVRLSLKKLKKNI
jgi:hypothetical protein